MTVQEHNACAAIALAASLLHTVISFPAEDIQKRFPRLTQEELFLAVDFNFDFHENLNAF